MFNCMRPHTNHKESGYTLFELLLYIVISGSLLLALSGFYGLTVASRAKFHATQEVDSQAVAALELITRVVRNGKQATTPVAGSSASTLTITQPGSQPTIVFDIDTNGTLRMKTGANNPVNITNDKVNITSFTVSNVSRPSTPGSITIAMSMERKTSFQAKKYRYSNTYSAVATMRPQL